MTAWRTRDGTLARTILVLLVAAGFSAPLFAAPRYFIARFQNRLSPHLEDPDQAFVVADGLIFRTLLQPTPSPCCSSDRHYITTERSDYVSLDWTYEITVHSQANATDEVLFVGFGEAVQDPLFYNEPQNSVYLAIHSFPQGASLGSDVRLSAHDVGMWSHTYLHFPGSFEGPQGSTYTVRIRKVGRSVTFEILGTDVAATIPDIVGAAPFLSQVPTRIFFGNAVGNYSFSDMRVLPERPRGHGKTRYAIVDLGTLAGGSLSEAVAINERGQVVGRSLTAGQQYHAFIWEDGRMIDLGTLPGGSYSEAHGINNRGEVVGVSETTGQGCGSDGTSVCDHAFLWRHGRMFDLGTLGGPYSSAFGISDRGQIAGASVTASGDSRAVLWTAGAIVDVGKLPGYQYARATAVNNRGEVAAVSEEPSQRGFYWHRGETHELPLLPGGCCYNYASDINDRGQIAGFADSGASHPVVWWGDKISMLDIGDAYAGYGNAINDAGAVVGMLIVFPNEDHVPVLWEHGVLTELPALPPQPGYPVDAVPSDINNRGQIVGTSVGHAVLWTKQ